MRRSVRLSRAAGEWLLCLLDRRRSAASGAALRELPQFVQSELMEGSWLSQSVRNATAAIGGDGYLDLVWQPDRQAYAYFDAADGLVTVDAAALARWDLNVPRWLAWLGDCLDLANAGNPTEIVADIAWDLGDLWVSRQRKVPLLFARRLESARSRAVLEHALDARIGRSGGIILTSSKAETGTQLGTSRQVLTPIASILKSSADVFEIDRDLLIGPFAGSKGTQPPQAPIHLSPDGRLLTIHGTVTVAFKSEIQIGIIRILVDGYSTGRLYRASYLLEKGRSNAHNLENAFGPKWKVLRPYLHSVGGLWGFKV